MDVVVVHAEDQNTRPGICGFQPRDHLKPADPGQVQIEDDQGGPLISENLQRLLSGSRFANFGGRFHDEQSPRSERELSKRPICHSRGRAYRIE
jgi:hypothetical protein